MRVIAGRAKGRRLVAPAGRGTRPTADRVKEALFSSLQPRLPGAHVLDLYAGSGALGIEALSRGASAAVFVERDRRALAALRRNLDTTGLADRATVLPVAVERALSEPLGPALDLAFLDPPYRVGAATLARTLARLVPVLAPGARVCLEAGRSSPPPRWPPDLLAGEPRHYGDTVVHVADLTAA